MLCIFTLYGQYVIVLYGQYVIVLYGQYVIVLYGQYVMCTVWTDMLLDYCMDSMLLYYCMDSMLLYCVDSMLLNYCYSYIVIACIPANFQLWQTNRQGCIDLAGVSFIAYNNPLSLTNIGPIVSRHHSHG